MNTNLFTPTKKIRLKLVGLDSNAFSLVGAFRKQARKENWTAEEITKVTDKCMQGDYSNVICTLMEHCK